MSFRPRSPWQSLAAFLPFLALTWGTTGCTLESTGPHVADSTAADTAEDDSAAALDPASQDAASDSENEDESDASSPRTAPSASTGNAGGPDHDSEPHPKKDSPPSSASPATPSSAAKKEEASSADTAKPKTPSRRPVVITFDDLELKMQLDSKFSPDLLTQRVRELDGERVSIKGFIYAAGVFQQTGIQRFPLVKNTQCKFGPGGLAYCVILVSLKEGVTTNFTLQPVTVEGILKVEPYEGPDGITWSVYRLVGERVY